MVTFKESLNVLWDHGPATSFPPVKPAATALVPQPQGQNEKGNRGGGDTPKKVEETAELCSDASSSSFSLTSSSQGAELLRASRGPNSAQLTGKSPILPPLPPSNNTADSELPALAF